MGYLAALMVTSKTKISTSIGHGNYKSHDYIKGKLKSRVRIEL